MNYFALFITKFQFIDGSEENSLQEESNSKFDKLVFIRKLQSSDGTANEQISKAPRKAFEEAEDELTVEEIADGYEPEVEMQSNINNKNQKDITNNKKIQNNHIMNPEIGRQNLTESLLDLYSEFYMN